MCTRVTCSRCQKPTFAGCGRHVEQVLGDVAPEDRCRCRERDESSPSKAASFLERLLGNPGGQR